MHCEDDDIIPDSQPEALDLSPPRPSTQQQEYQPVIVVEESPPPSPVASPIQNRGTVSLPAPRPPPRPFVPPRPVEGSSPQGQPVPPVSPAIRAPVRLQEAPPALPTAVGFQTASNKAVHLSESALARANQMLRAVLDEPVPVLDAGASSPSVARAAESPLPQRSPTPPAEPLGFTFTTGLGTAVPIPSPRALKRAASQLGADADEGAPVSQESQRRRTEAGPVLHPGFSFTTGSGKPFAAPSTAALRRAAELLDLDSHETDASAAHAETAAAAQLKITAAQLCDGLGDCEFQLSQTLGVAPQPAEIHPVAHETRALHRGANLHSVIRPAPALLHPAAKPAAPVLSAQPLVPVVHASVVPTAVPPVRSSPSVFAERRLPLAPERSGPPLDAFPAGPATPVRARPSMHPRPFKSPRPATPQPPSAGPSTAQTRVIPAAAPATPTRPAATPTRYVPPPKSAENLLDRLGRPSVSDRSAAEWTALGFSREVLSMSLARAEHYRFASSECARVGLAVQWPFVGHAEMTELLRQTFPAAGAKPLCADRVEAVLPGPTVSRAADCAAREPAECCGAAAAAVPPRSRAWAAAVFAAAAGGRRERAHADGAVRFADCRCPGGPGRTVQSGGNRADGWVVYDCRRAGQAADAATGARPHFCWTEAPHRRSKERRSNDRAVGAHHAWLGQAAPPPQRHTPGSVERAAWVRSSLADADWAGERAPRRRADPVCQADGGALLCGEVHGDFA
eukprot:TRINITY_DN4029_c0_g1_i2.p1 TRINITY_DN4029_c0_g1~~TRINITY_DN4029_c0_g1_i2.p1  ORF type:complete len:739 (+),score=93.62 TRINITY_DN4029_c0_g1_i2:52-2268(+)